MSLLFDGVDDRLSFTTLSTALCNLPTGAFTAVILMSRASWTGGTDGWDIGWVLNDTPGPTFGVRAGFEWQAGTVLAQQDNSANHNWTHGLGTLTDVPLLVVLSKASGLAAPAWSVKNMNTAAWTHGSSSTNGQNDVAVPTTGGLVFGGYPGNAWVDLLQGYLGIFAAWTGVAMTQAQRMECGANSKTSDLLNHSAGAPISVIEFTSLTPSDLKGGVGSISSISSPTLDNAVTLGWTYDGGAPTRRRAGQGRSGQGRSNYILIVGSDTTPPGNINVTSVTASKISRVVGKDSANVTFSADEAFVEYQIRKVSSASDGIGAGTLVEQATIAGGSAPVRVQKATPTSSGVSGATLTVTLPSNVAVGNHIVVPMFFSGALGLTVTVTDQAGNSYTVDVLTDDGNSTGAYSAIATAKCTTALTAGQTITMTVSASVTYRMMSAYEYSGLHPTSWVEAVSNTGKGSSTAPASGSVTAAAGDLLIGVTSYNSGTASHSPTAPWSELDDVTVSASKAFAVDEQNNVAAGSYTHTGTLGSSVLWSDSIAAYKPAAAAGGVTQYTTTLTDDELVAGAAAEGTNLFKVFVKDAAGNWSA